MARILIAEDDADVRQIVSHLVIELGHEVAVARDGHDALERLMTDPPELLVLDINMPKVDGYTVLQELNASPVAAAVKVLVLTARGAEGDFERSFDLGASKYMTKPFDPIELIEQVEQLLALSKEELTSMREKERDKAHLLSQFESLLGDA